jgi:hypothetical protein
MKKTLFWCCLIAGWLACLPAYATTYSYNVNYSFTTTPGQVAGSIDLSCDSCILTASNVLSWSFTASDGASGSSSGPTAGINASGDILEATPTGIFTVADATINGYFAFCSDISDNGSDCFSTAGLNVYNIFHGFPQPTPAWHISWEENSSAEGIFSTDGGGASPNPSIEIAARAVPELPVWAMMIVGFGVCGFAALRGRRRKATLRPA